MDYLSQDLGNYGVLKLTEKTRLLLRGEERLNLARPRLRPVAAKAAPKKGRGEFPYDEQLFQNLRALRKQLADDRQVPPFVIFGDFTLLEMAARRPQNNAELSMISGVGSHKLGCYGPAFLEILKQ